MEIDYKELAKQYQPDEVNILLIGEAPPPSKKSYFYMVPDIYSPKRDIRSDRSLPSTIFNHYFGRRPSDSKEYEIFLNKLKNNGIFLIDIYEEPIQIRNNQENLDLIFSVSNLDRLLIRVGNLCSKHTQVIFLLARSYSANYRKLLESKFPNAYFYRWIDFRINANSVCLK